jgi:hypothetical protein
VGGAVTVRQRRRQTQYVQVNYGLLTNRAGCPVAISVYAANTGDAKTLPDQDELDHGGYVGHRGNDEVTPIDARSHYSFTRPRY